MIMYFEIKPGTKEYDAANNVFLWKAEWLKPEVIKDIECAIGMQVEKNVEINPYILRVERLMPYINVRNQFKNKCIDGRYEAKANSSINKKFLEVVRKHDLKIYSMTEFSLLFGWGNVGALCPVIMPDSRRFFLQMSNDISNKIMDEFRDHPALNEIPEREYLILRAKMLRANGD